MHREILKPTKCIKKIFPDIDGIFIINLKTRDDRYENILNQLNKIDDLKESVYIIRSDKDKEGNFRRGCYETHRFVAKLSLQNNYKNTIVFEDDFTLEPKRFRKISDYMKKLQKTITD
jgi:hypothetical protein